MAVLIAATDFSDIGNNAVNYACRLSSDMNASVIVFHSFLVPVTFSDTPMPILPVDERQKIAEERMSQFLLQLRSFYPEVKIEGKIIYGDVIDDLEEFTEEEMTPRLVVMGNTGDISLLIGSTVLTALRDLPVPVLSIPAGVVYKPVKKICFAYDHKQMKDYSPVYDLAALVKELNAELHVLNVEHGSTERSEEGITNGELHTILASLQPRYHLIDNGNTDLAIGDFINSNHMDWLVVIPHKHSFFERLFHKSHIADLVHTIHIPLIGLHERGIRS